MKIALTDLPLMKKGVILKSQVSPSRQIPYAIVICDGQKVYIDQNTAQQGVKVPLRSLKRGDEILLYNITASRRFTRRKSAPTVIANWIPILEKSKSQEPIEIRINDQNKPFFPTNAHGFVEDGISLGGGGYPPEQSQKTTWWQYVLRFLGFKKPQIA